MRWKNWVVRMAIFGFLFMILVVGVGGRVRADRALERSAEVAKLGAPGEVAARAQQAVSAFTNKPSVVIRVERELDHWRATVMSGPTCYEIAVDDLVSAHPGLIPCPAIASAGTDDDTISSVDVRYQVIGAFLTDWLTGNPEADRYLAAERPSQRLLPENATSVKLVQVWGNREPGSRTMLTAQADVQYVDRVERLAWTFVMRLDGQRWAIEQLAGGEIPTADPQDLMLGIVPNTTTTTAGTR